MMLVTCGLILALGLPGQVADNTERPAPFHVKVIGKGRPMVLIPGLACSGDVWNTTVEHFRGNYECHVLTLAGFAGQPPVSGPFLQTVREGIAKYVRQKNLKKPVLVGHSIGGFLIFSLGAKEPDLVGPLIAVDGVPCLAALFIDKTGKEDLKKQAEQMRDQTGKLPRASFLAQQKAIIQTMVRDKKYVDLIAGWGEKSDQATVAKAVAEQWSMDLRGVVRDIKAPVLMIAAYSKDMESFGLKREDVTKQYEAQIKGIAKHKLAVAENARHFVMLDAPDWLFKQMDEFLSSK